MSDRLISLDDLKPHPNAELMPDPSEEEFDALVESIEENGVLVPLTCSEFTIIDGHTRWRAARVAGLDEVPVIRLAARTKDEQLGLLFELNLARRQMGNDQKRQLARNVLKKWPKKSDRALASMTGLSHPFIGSVRTELELLGDVEETPTREGKDGVEQKVEKKTQREGREVTEEDVDDGVRRAVFTYAGTDEKVAALRETGATDDELMAFVGDRLGNGGASGGPEKPWVEHKGGANPEVTVKWDLDDDGVRLTPAALRDRVRDVFEIPYPEDVDDTSEPEAQETEGISPKDLECPNCGAEPGSPCRRPSGHAVFGGGFHAPRVDAWKVEVGMDVDTGPQEDAPDLSDETGDLSDGADSAPSSTRREDNPDIEQMIEERLTGEGEQPSVKALFEASRKINPRISELSLRQFNARYVLQVKRRLAAEEHEREKKAKAEDGTPDVEQKASARARAEMLRLWPKRVPAAPDIPTSETKELLAKEPLDEEACDRLLGVSRFIQKIVSVSNRVRGEKEPTPEPEQEETPEPAGMPV